MLPDEITRSEAPLIKTGLQTYATRETPGSVDNPVIMGWAKELGFSQASYPHDSVPWCGLWTALVVKRAGLGPVPSVALRALAWQTYGETCPPGMGDVLVFRRQGGGHVGLYAGERPGYYLVLGGNQNDAVGLAWLAKTRLATARRPLYKTPAPWAVPWQAPANAAGIGGAEA